MPGTQVDRAMKKNDLGTGVGYFNLLGIAEKAGQGQIELVRL